MEKVVKASGGLIFGEYALIQIDKLAVVDLA
ncbi:uncharacterized protein METZ01_LOCUS425081, partial [marine metagenome]